MDFKKSSFIFVFLFSLCASSAVHFTYQLQCEENSYNAKSTTCTFNEVVGDQKTFWVFEPTADTRWTYKIVPENIIRVIFKNAAIPEIPKGLFKYYFNTKIIIATQAKIIGLYSYTFQSAQFLERIEMPNNEIKLLKSGIFVDCPLLQSIDLSHNKIAQVEEKAFAGLKALKTLDLSGNFIKVLSPNVFIDLGVLETLVLSENQIESITELHFIKNPWLSHIDLSRNLLRQIRGQTFQHMKNLTVLNVAYNQLTECEVNFAVKIIITMGNSIKMMKVSSSVEKLDASSNQMKSFVCAPGVQIQHLELHNNSLVDLGAFGAITMIKYLDVSKNPINTVRPDAFNNLRNLEHLELDGCGIHNLPSTLFSNNKKLKYVDLANNQLGQFDVTILSYLDRIDDLYLDGNGLTEVNFDAIKDKFSNFSNFGISNNNWNCDYLRQLISEIKKYHIRVYFNEPVMDGPQVDFIACQDKPKSLIRCEQDLAENSEECTFSQVKGSLQQEWKYEVLYVEYTFIKVIRFVKSNLFEIPRLMFQSFPNAESLIIKGCQLQQVSPESFQGGQNLHYVDLSENELTSLKPGVFIDAAHVYTLILSFNQISNVHENAFQGLSELITLDLSHNKIQQLPPNVFYLLIHLEVIKLNYNDLKVIPDDLFMKCTMLKNIDLSYNMIVHITVTVFKPIQHLEMVSLEYNEIADFAYTLPNVDKIALTGNKITKYQISPSERKVFVANNQIETLEIPEQNQITELVVTNNSLQDISQLSKLTHLEVLDLSYNSLQPQVWVDVEVFKPLKNLKIMNLQGSHITELNPQMFSTMHELKTLDLTNNEISNLDFSSIKLQNLEHLSVENNALTEFSFDQIQQCMPNLRQISLAGNQWECNYLRELIEKIKRNNIEIVVKDPVTNAPNVDGIFCITAFSARKSQDGGCTGSCIPSRVEQHPLVGTNRSVSTSGAPSLFVKSHNCCEEIALIRSKVATLEAEIYTMKSERFAELEVQLEEKGKVIAEQLRQMVHQMMSQQQQQQRTDGAGLIQRRFQVEEGTKG